MEKVFSQKGGVRLDVFNLTWPFAKIIVNSESIIIQAFWKKYLLKKNEISNLRKYSGIFSKGLLIEHKRKDYPHHMVFWTLNLQRLKNAIEDLGYSIGESVKSDSWWRGGP